MRSALASVTQRRGNRSRSNSLNTVPPARSSTDFDHDLANLATSIIYKSPLPSEAGLPTYIVNAAAFPDAYEVDYNALLPYVLARLPDEDELISGTEYEIIFFAGGQPEGATTEKKQGPGVGWYLQAYQVLSRATRKKLQKLYIVHPRTWVRVLVNVFGTVVSPKFRRKIVHVNTLTGLALLIPIERLLIPPVVYVHDRKLCPEIDVPYASGRRAFGATKPLPESSVDPTKTRLPRVLRETTSFILLPPNIKTEGLFRIPPHTVLTGVLREAYDRGQMYIIWKEVGATFVEPGVDPGLVSEVKIEDAYGVHSAASLIKTWYRELRQPIFPESSYASLRDQFGSPDVEITIEDLENIFSTNSVQSPLSTTSREILLRHLLPMLSIVAAQEPKNKMDANNLAICFAMTLVCGSNQLEDAKMTSVIRRIIQAAVEEWHDLQQRLSIKEADFWKDLQPPYEAKDYEDPLDEPKPMPHFDEASEESHTVHLLDAELSGDEDDMTLERAPTLPPRPATSHAVPTFSGRAINDERPPIPKRKPAPSPPRYSTLFNDHEKGSLIADSPEGYASAEESLPLTRGSSLNEKSSLRTPSAELHHLEVPKRKALARQIPSADLTQNVARSASEATAAHLAHQAAQRASTSSQRASIPEPLSAPGALGEDEKAQQQTASDANTFRKPSWPASRPPHHQNQLPTLAKPIIPHRPRSHEPTSIAMLSASDEFRHGLPKLRSTSSDLLKRMEAANASAGANGSLQPGGAGGNGLRKASVDDLRRVFEERAGGGREGNGGYGEGRRGSGVS